MPFAPSNLCVASREGELLGGKRHMIGPHQKLVGSAPSHPSSSQKKLTERHSFKLMASKTFGKATRRATPQGGATY